MSRTSIKNYVRSNFHKKEYYQVVCPFHILFFSQESKKEKPPTEGDYLMGCLLCVLKWYNGFIFIIQLLYYHYFLILFRATHMNSYHYYFVAAMHHYTFLLYLVLQSNTMCQQNMSHEAEVLCSDVCLQKESHSIDVQVHTLRIEQTAASVRRY